MASQHRTLGILLASGLLLRLALFTGLSEQTLDTLGRQVELSTPLTNYRRLKEGIFLYQHGIPPYDGGVNHQPPLLMVLFSLTNSVVNGLDTLIFASIDVACGYWLWKIAQLKPNLDQALWGPPTKETRIAPCAPAWVAALYLFNPYTLLCCLARSTASFSHLSILATAGLALQGRSIASLGALACATYLSFYPITLLPAVLLILHAKPSVRLSNIVTSRLGQWHLAVFGFWCALLLGVSRLLIGSWDFLAATYGVILSVPDLTPNVGIFWYYFVEMFDHFRPLFLVVFQLNALLYALPITYRLQRFPLHSLFVLCGIMSVFKSYPSWGDAALHLAWLPLFTELFTYLRYTFLVSLVYTFASALAIVFYHIWIVLGTGNANFFFAITLVHALGQIMLLIDSIYAVLRREFFLLYPAYRQHKVVQT